MSDKQLARSGTVDFDVLADDDPLAELARIVGYDNRPAIQQLQELERHREAVRREPVLDLEDELLREFDVYDTPHGGPAVDAPEPVGMDDHIAFAPLPEASDFVPATAVEPQAADYEAQEPLPDFAVDAESPVAESAPLFEEPVLVEPEAQTVSVNDEPVVDVLSPAPEPDFAEAENVWSTDFENQPVFDGTDLEHELELSIGYEDYQAEMPAAETPATDALNFEPERDFGPRADAADHSAEDVRSSVFEEPVAIYEPVAVDPVADLSAAIDQPAALTAQPDGGMQDQLPVWQPEPEQSSQTELEQALKPELEQALQPELDEASKVGDSVIAATDVSGIDALLADVERFPVPASTPVKSAASVDVARKVNYPFTPTFSRATPVASIGGISSQKAFATPLPALVPVLAAVAETAYQPAEIPVEPVVTQAAPALKAPVDQDPDFDLDTFELDLSGIDLDIDPSEFEMAAQDIDFALPDVDPEPPVSAAAVMAAPADDVVAEDVPQDEEPVRYEPESVLPFDPSMISETEESLSVIADLNVPQLPIVEQERPVVHQPDYDLDIDAEMAQLFGTSSRNAAVANSAAADEIDFGSAAQPLSQDGSAGGGARVEEDFDEFEKAMEEDFRLSLSQRQEADASSDRMADGSGYTENSDFDEEGSGTGKRRLILLAAAVAGLAIFGGVGVYAFMGGGSSVLTGGEPKIILADKSPVKMVPVEKGGKTVPNQDKAVYDRVAGAQDTTPLQGTLVSSTEEPVDVVQRTLTPENLPLEGAGEDLPGVAPAEEDGDERLLPDGQAAENTVAEEDSSPAVSPRKVRTMIVKPDGTLVAREEPVAQPETTIAAAENSAKQAEPQVKMVKTTAITQQLETGAVPKSLPVTEQPVVQEKSALAEAADATVEETAPVRSVKTTAVADANPVPEKRPVQEPVVQEQAVEEPVKVVDTFKTKPVQQAQPIAEAKPVEAKPVETAAVAPGTYVMQIASLPSEAEAQRSYKSLSGKFGNVIGGMGVDIKKAEIAGKGTYFRVRIPAGTREAANALCSRYKSAGGSCLVTK